MRIVIILFFIEFISWLTPVFAAAPKCVPVPFKIEGKNIILPGAEHSKTSVVYFFQNKSLQSLWIDHIDQTGRGMNAGWGSYIRPSHWSALVLNKKSFSVTCSMIQPDKVEPLDCSKTLAVCAPQNIVTPTPLEGNYWLAEDKNWDNFLHALEKRGVSFH